MKPLIRPGNAQAEIGRERQVCTQIDAYISLCLELRVIAESTLRSHEQIAGLGSPIACPQPPVKLPCLVWSVDKGHLRSDIEERSVSGDVRENRSSRFGIGIVRLLCRQIRIFSTQTDDTHPLLIKSEFFAPSKACIQMLAKNGLRNAAERSVTGRSEVVSVRVDVFVIEEDAGVGG